MELTKEVIVLVNFNEYLGGGETLFVRFSTFLQEKGVEFVVFCRKDSYIESDLKKRKISSNKIMTFGDNPNYYYLNKVQRNNFISQLSLKLNPKTAYRFVTFCLRDLYTIYDLSSNCNCSVTHLVLHPEDDLYVGQTLLDKLNYKLFGKRVFNEKKILDFNHKLLRVLNDRNGIISMTDVIADLWKVRGNINIDDNYIVPLPSFKPLDELYVEKVFSNKIIWIGRIVDFKIPSLINMINFVNKNDYELTIVGSGDLNKIHNYISRNGINTSKLNFIGEVDYSELHKVINQHSIGYAMGTSLIELARFKMPVIVALASFDHKNFKSQICGGLFYDKYKGCDGTDLLFTKKEDIKTTILNTIDKIKADYTFAAEACYQFAEKDFSEEKNFNQYLEIIQNTKHLSNEDKKGEIPEASGMRKYMFKKVNNN